MLNREYGLNVGLSKVRRLMRSMNLPKIFSKKSPTYSSKSESGDYKNILNRKFHQSAPNQILVSDITYIKVGQKWFYLCVIIDLFSRKVISWKISDKPDAELVVSTFKKAYANRNFSKGLILRRLFANCLRILMLFNLFPAKAVLTTTPLLNLFSNFLNRRQ